MAPNFIVIRTFTMDSHPAYTGEKRLVDTAGRVEKFHEQVQARLHEEISSSRCSIFLALRFRRPFCWARGAEAFLSLEAGASPRIRVAR